VGLRGVTSIFAIARQTVARWLKAHVQNLPAARETVLPATPDEVLELDEIRSPVHKTDHQRKLWIAIRRRMRQIVGFAIGYRRKATFLHLYESIPDEYNHYYTFSDFLACFPTHIPG
jgi:hypothetical protein